MKKGILIIVILLVLVAAGYYFKGYLFTNNPGNDTAEEVMQIVPEDVLVYEVKNEDLSDYQKETHFNRFNNAKVIIEDNIKNGLELNCDENFYAWLEVASVQKVIEDFDRAATIWKWFTQSYPYNSISPANLGELYKTFVIDREQSEKYYLIALDREKKDFNIYMGLHDLYLYRFEDVDRAVDVMKQGLENNPDDKNYIYIIIKDLKKENRYGEAEEVVEKYISTHPEDYALRSKLD